MDHHHNRLVTAAARAAAAGAHVVATESPIGRHDLAEALRELERLLSSRASPPSLRAAYAEAAERLRDAERREALAQAAANPPGQNQGRRRP